MLEARVGKRPSFAWRSIHSACDLLREGLVWRVGNGSNVRIWKDRWLPSPNTFWVCSPPVGLDMNATVDALIDGNTMGWNVPLLESTFTAEEVQVIQSIPLSCTNQEDVQIWRGTKNGVYSVRSAYYIQQELLVSTAASSSRGYGGSDLWKTVWALPVPNVEKNFLWRACHDILPTR